MVQTFIVEDSKDLIYEEEKILEWREKCEALGLSGQLELIKKDKSPIPFESMNTVSNRVYSTLCPTVTNYKKYNKTTIPLEVLGIIKLSEDEHYFDEIQIWYDDKTPDPLAVGILKKGSDWDRDYFILARWGDVLRPFKELKEMAIARYKKSSKLKLRTKIKEAENNLANLDLNVELYFEAENQEYNVIGF